MGDYNKEINFYSQLSEVSKELTYLYQAISESENESELGKANKELEDKLQTALGKFTILMLKIDIKINEGYD